MIDMKLTYQTRDGRPVRLLCVDGNHATYKVVGFIGTESGITYWSAKGYHFNSEMPGPHDLIEVKPKAVVKKWLNIIQRPDKSIRLYQFDTEESALMMLPNPYVTVLVRAVPFEWSEP